MLARPFPGEAPMPKTPHFLRSSFETPSKLHRGSFETEIEPLAGNWPASRLLVACHRPLACPVPPRALLPCRAQLGWSPMNAQARAASRCRIPGRRLRMLSTFGSRPSASSALRAFSPRASLHGPGNIQHPTSNFQHPICDHGASGGGWLVVGCWILEVRLRWLMVPTQPETSVEAMHDPG